MSHAAQQSHHVTLCPRCNKLNIVVNTVEDAAGVTEVTTLYRLTCQHRNFQTNREWREKWRTSINRYRDLTHGDYRTKLAVIDVPDTLNADSPQLTIAECLICTNWISRWQEVELSNNRRHEVVDLDDYDNTDDTMHVWRLHTAR